mgnify:FL=1|jgi:hypothetical protein
MAKRVNYLNNKDMLAEIHKSKNNFCYYIDQKKYNQFDIILLDIIDINQETIQTAKETQAKRIKDATVIKLKAEKKNVRATDVIVEPDSIPLEDLVFRVMTFDHIPKDPTRKRTPKTVADHHVKLPFPPFKHYAYIDNELTEVGRSHWKGGLKNGKFEIVRGLGTRGQITDKLALMYLKLVERYSMRSNWRGYTYVDDMRGQALLQLSQIGLQFDESKSQNPFAYYTAAITNSFTRILNVEKRNQNIRDDILQQAGAMPSFTRQFKDLEEQQKRKQKRQEELSAKKQKE